MSKRDNYEYDYEEKNINYGKIILLSAAVIILIILLIVLKSIGKNEEKKYLLFDNYKAVEFNNNKLSYVKDKKYLDSKYNVYTEEEAYFDYIIKERNSNHTIFNKKLNDVELTSNFIGLSNNIKYIDFNKRNITKDDLMYFNEISELNIKKATDLTQASYIEIDIDNDGDLEYIYEGTYESNNNVKNGYSNEDFSTIFYLDNNKINVIELSKPFVEDKELYFDSYLIKEIIDLDNDGNLELIVEDYLFDYGTYNIYKIKDGKYKLFFTCDYE